MVSEGRSRGEMGEVEKRERSGGEKEEGRRVWRREEKKKRKGWERNG